MHILLLSTLHFPVLSLTFSTWIFASQLDSDSSGVGLCPLPRWFFTQCQVELVNDNGYPQPAFTSEDDVKLSGSQDSLWWSGGACNRDRVALWCRRRENLEFLLEIHFFLMPHLWAVSEAHPSFIYNITHSSLKISQPLTHPYLSFP